MLGLAACQNDPEGLNVNADGTVNTTLSVTLPEATRAGSDVGGLTHFNSATHDIRYILEVYNDAGKLVKERDTKLSDAGSVVFDLRLIPNRDYNFVVWADFVENGSKADCYYNTDAEGAGLRNVSVVDSDEVKWTAMNELRDAYTGVKRIEGYNSSSTIDLTLTRPFAKLRVVTTDIDELYGILPEKVQVEYRTDVYRGFDAFAAEAKNASAKAFDYTLANVYDDYNDKVNRTLFTDYLFGTAKGSIQFDMYIGYNDQGSTTTLNFNTEIPVERNYLTTVKGNLLTDDNDFTVTIDESFAGYHNDGGNLITTNEELKDALTQNVENIAVVLGANLTYDVAAEASNMGGDKTKTITISGVENTRAAQPYTLTFNLKNSDWSNVATNATLVLKDLNINTSGHNTGDRLRTHINYNCDVEMYNVTTTPVNFEKSAVVKDVTVNSDNGQYAIWVTANGQNVTLEDLTVDAADARGIKIDEQYVDSPAKVVMNIKDATFKTAEKAAILVKSAAGADITLENVDITEVAADPINAVWVDEDAKQYADLVTVKGGTKAIEGSADTNIVVVSNADELKTAISNASATEVGTIYLKGGYYAGYFLVSDKKILLTTTEDVTIDGLINLTGNTAYVGVRNITLTNANPQKHYETSKYLSRADGYIFGVYNGSLDIQDCTINVVATGGINQHADVTGNTLTVKNTTFNCNGQRPIRARANVHIEGCTFVDQQRYAVQSQFNNTLSSQKMVFINNKIVNPCVTSGEPFAAGVQISHSQICENVAFTIANNELTSTKFNDLKFAYDHEEASNSFGNIKITTCTLNGQHITEDMLLEINEDTNEVSTTMTKPEVDENVVTIKTAKELFWFANEVNVKNNSFSGKTVKLDADIDLENAEWTPVGQTGATQFKGTFDGQNYTISNLNIDKTSETGKHYSSGLFGWLNAATVKDVKVNGATVKGNHNVAVIAGYLETAGCTVENCHVSNVAVECHHANGDACGDKAGGVVGHAGNSGVSVKDCTAKISTVKAGRDAGQIVGAAKEANVTGCSAENVEVSALDGCNDSNAGGNIRNAVIGRIL